MAGIEHNQAAGGTLWRDLLSFGVYKRTQGRIARQVTFAALAITLATGIWRLAQLLPVWFVGTAGTSATDLGVLRFLVPGVLLAVGLWILFRLVNYPPFADFLIAVEAEMAKVSWPMSGSLKRQPLGCCDTANFTKTTTPGSSKEY